MAFSSPVVFDDTNIVIPLRTKNDIWSFLKPFDYRIWIATILSIPLFVLVMGCLEFHANGKVNWDQLVGFVFRNALSETMEKLPHKTLHEKWLVLGWVWSCFVLIMAYSGNLTAMISRPGLDMRFTKPEDFLYQSEILLVTEDGTATVEFMKHLPINSTMRQLLDETQMLSENGMIWPSGCFTKDKQYTQRHASICDSYSILGLIHSDYSETGKCNWYTLQSAFKPEWAVMAFQVGSQIEML